MKKYKSNVKIFFKNGQVFNGNNQNSFLIGPVNGNEIGSKNSGKNQGSSNSTFSTIDLGNCETILKEKNGIAKDKSLLILISEKLTTNATERNTQFEVYDPDTFQKLDLSECEDEPITVSTPIEMTDELNEIKEAFEELKESGYNLFNKNDKFYTDICTPYTSKDKTDIPLSDRFNEFYLNSEAKCSSGCEFDGYDFDTNRLNCKCNVITSDIDLSKLKVDKGEDKDVLYKSFVDVLKFSNYKVLRCFNLAFNSNIFSYNYGTYMSFGYFLLYFVSLCISIKKGLNPILGHIPKDLLEFNDPIKNELPKTRNNEKTLNLNSENDSINNEENLGARNRKSTRKKSRKKSRRKSSKGHLQNSNDNHSGDITDAPPRKKSGINIPRLSKRKSSKKNMYVISDKAIKPKEKDDEMVEKYKFNRISTFRKRKTGLPVKEDASDQVQKEYDDFELNKMEYEEALENDHRDFPSIYFSLLKREHLLIFSFCVRDDYNLTFVKFCRLFFLLATDMCLNVFFFLDKTMHTMYLDYGKYNFIQHIPQIIYSTIVSQIFDVLLSYLSMTDTAYYRIKRLNAKDRFKLLRILKCTKIKLIIFYIFTFSIFAFNWYTITCFCAVYRNTQGAFIKNSLSSFGTGQIYPFILYLFPAILRIMALKCCQSGCVYKFSDIIPFF